MTDYDEEQAMEVEMLESIFVDEFKADADNPKAFSLALLPSQGGATENYVGLTLKCTYTPTYPDALPDFEVIVDKGLKPAHKVEVEALVKDTAEENLGMAMVFTVAEAVKEWLVANNKDHGDGSLFSMMMASQKAEAEPEEVELDDEGEPMPVQEEDPEVALARRLALGTAVTADTFAEWQAKFDAEKASLAPTVADASADKLTGREFFERGMHRDGGGGASAAAASPTAGAGDTDGDGDGGAGGEEVVYDEALFLEGEDDVDLSDLDDDDEDNDA